MSRLAYVTPLITIAVIPFLVGCKNSAQQERITLLEDQNIVLERRLSEVTGDKEMIVQERDRVAQERDRAAAERDRASEELLAALQANTQFQERLAKVPEPREVAPGWTAVEGGGMIVLGTGTFRAGAVVLRDEARKKLDAVASSINRDYPDKDIIVVGHTDDRPITKSGWEDNYQLSVERALAVVRYLSGRGVNPERLIAAGCGEHRPRTPNTSDTNRQANRRVEILAIDLNLPRGG